MKEYGPSNNLVITSVLILLIGLTLTVVGFSIDLSALGIFGSSIVGASTVLVYRLIKAKKNKKFAKELSISQKDERLLRIYVHAGNMTFWIGFLAVIAFSVFTGTKNAFILFFPTILLTIYLVSAFYFTRKF